MEKKYKAILYMRVSYTDDRTSESESLANQRRLMEDFLKGYPEIEVVSEKLDDGYTGLLFDRPAFKEMMQDVMDEKVNCIIVKDLSRLGREYIETGNYLRNIFPSYGVRFIAITDSIDTAKDEDLSGKLDVTLKTIMNDAYSRDISKKTRTALMTKRKNGDYIGACAIYGYVKSEENKNQLAVDSYTAEIVRDIFKMKTEGISAAKIADNLNSLGILSPLAYKKDRGLPHPKGGFADRDNVGWSATTIIRILKDETYTGSLIQGKQCTFSYKLKELKDKPQEEWIVTPNAHEAIIRKQDFDLVQKIMNIDTRTAPNETGVYLFSGVLVCGCCGNRLTRKTVPYKDKKYFYYYCPTGKKNGCKGSKMIKESELEGCISHSVKVHINSVISLDETLSSMCEKKINLRLVQKATVQISDVGNQIEKISSYKASLYESLINGVVTKEEHKSMKSGYELELLRLKNARDTLNKELTAIKENTSERMKWMEHFKQFEGIADIDRSVVIQLIHSITVTGNHELHIKFRYESEYENALNLLKFQKEAV